MFTSKLPHIRITIDRRLSVFKGAKGRMEGARGIPLIFEIESLGFPLIIYTTCSTPPVKVNVYQARHEI